MFGYTRYISNLLASYLVKLFSADGYVSVKVNGLCISVDWRGTTGNADAEWSWSTEQVEMKSNRLLISMQ